MVVDDQHRRPHAPIMADDPDGHIVGSTSTFGRQPSRDNDLSRRAVGREELGLKRNNNRSSAVPDRECRQDQRAKARPQRLWQRSPHAPDSRTALVAVDCGQPQVPRR